MAHKKCPVSKANKAGFIPIHFNSYGYGYFYQKTLASKINPGAVNFLGIILLYTKPLGSKGSSPKENTHFIFTGLLFLTKRDTD